MSKVLCKLWLNRNKSHNTMNNRKSKTINKIVNVSEYGDITVLNNLFIYKNGFQGATGAKFQPVSKEYFEKETSNERINEILNGCGIDDITATNMDIHDKTDLAFDTSYKTLWDYLRNELNLDENEAYIFNCIGRGRCFSEDFQGNKNSELSKQIREFETGSIKYQEDLEL